jgi:hypothetical protein
MAFSLALLGASAYEAPIPSSYDLLETVSITGNTASVTFSNLDGKYASNYQHLQVRALGRTDRGSTVDSIQVRMNGVTTNSYANHALRSLNSAMLAYAQLSQNRIQFMTCSGGSGTSGVFGNIIADFLNPFSTNMTTDVRLLSAWHNPDERILYYGGGQYFSNNAVNSLTFFSQAGASIVAGSRFAIYGIRKA